jgi:NAD kinase
LKLRKVLVLHKKSTFQLQAIEHRERRFVKLLEQGHEVVTRVKQAHSEHMETLERLEHDLKRRHIEYTVVARSKLREPVENVDLLISVGGDGTFLDASHFLENIPILGINSSRSSSFGHLCAANEKNFAKVLDDIESDIRQPHKLIRLELNLNGERLPELALNELLIARPGFGLARQPAQPVRYGLPAAQFCPLPTTAISTWCESRVCARAKLLNL